MPSYSTSAHASEIASNSTIEEKLANNINSKEQNLSNATLELKDEIADTTQQQNANQAKLLKIINLFKEYISHKTEGAIYNYSHYGYLKDFPKHLKCLINSDCNFEEHLKNSSEQHYMNTHNVNDNLTTSEKPGFFKGILCKLGIFKSKTCPVIIVAKPKHEFDFKTFTSNLADKFKFKTTNNTNSKTVKVAENASKPISVEKN